MYLCLEILLKSCVMKHLEPETEQHLHNIPNQYNNLF